MGDIGIVRSLKRKLESRDESVRTTSTAITFILVFYSECFALKEINYNFKDHSSSWKIQIGK